VPHILGIGVGFTVMVLAVGLGLAEVFDRLPWLYSVLRWVGAGYLLYLAWSIANSGPPPADVDTDAGSGADAQSKPARSGPMSFWNAAAFQWVNPKAWVMAVGAFSTYVPAHPSTLLVAGVALLFGVINIPSVGTWALSGAALRQALQVERTRRLFNIGMAALLVLSLVPLLK
jgi:threonine/homoserine/homoserine lactone efflux protein